MAPGILPTAKYRPSMDIRSVSDVPTTNNPIYLNRYCPCIL